jgi:hypothetical protein
MHLTIFYLKEDFLIFTMIWNEVICIIVPPYCVIDTKAVELLVSHAWLQTNTFTYLNELCYTHREA